MSAFETDRQVGLTVPVGGFVRFEIIGTKTEINSRAKGNLNDANSGVIILTYVICGTVGHEDSIGNSVQIDDGGVHYTKAGRVILICEKAESTPKAGMHELSVVRFWIVLSSAEQKKDCPEYRSLTAEEVPVSRLPMSAGRLKIICGSFKNKAGEIKSSTGEFVYHIELNAGKTFVLPAESQTDYAVFTSHKKTVVNGKYLKAGNFTSLASARGEIEIKNGGDSPIELILFGAKKKGTASAIP